MSIQQGSYFCSHDAVGIAEGHAGSLRQFVGAVGGEQFKATGGDGTFSIDLDIADNQCADIQAILYQVQRFHKGALGLLVVHIVACASLLRSSIICVSVCTIAASTLPRLFCT